MSTEINNSMALRSEVHLTRKLWHMGTGLSGLSIYNHFSLESRDMGIYLMALGLAALLVEFTRLNVSSFNAIILKVMKPFMRESERNSLSGFPFYALGAAISLLLFEEKIAILSILFLIFADPISSFFGILYGKDKIISNKSLQGCIAGFLVCYILTFAYGSYFYRPGVDLLVFSVLAGLFGALSELCSIVIDDNLTIPVLSGLGITAINILIPIF
ncbi:diacylglycerol/polyprenol kinase family protein [Halobacteriovorax marinus]|uniref:diacylglycerol/polyprenol kinase family protein n=1 Tax=Halobacteriovorax marinus TaxID=97084 RepID=UPI000BDF66BB|nr:phosphatidate cytidylyltransferase [Halobacteriovorax marinus]